MTFAPFTRKLTRLVHTHEVGWATPGHGFNTSTAGLLVGRKDGITVDQDICPFLPNPM